MLLRCDCDLSLRCCVSVAYISLYEPGVYFFCIVLKVRKENQATRCNVRLEKDVDLLSVTSTFSRLKIQKVKERS